MEEKASAMINAAIPIYVGFGITSYPVIQDSRLFEKFGVEAGPIISEINQIIAEMDSISAPTSMSLLEEARYVVSNVSKKFEYIDEEAKSALCWLHSFTSR